MYVTLFIPNKTGLLSNKVCYKLCQLGDCMEDRESGRLSELFYLVVFITVVSSCICSHVTNSYSVLRLCLRFAYSLFFMFSLN